MLGLRAEVERDQLAGRRRSSAITTSSDGPGEAVDPDQPASTARLASCTQALPGPAITSTGGDRLGAVGERGDRLGAADRVDLVDPAERRGGEDRRVRAGRPGPGGEATATRSTPATRAGIAHITTLEG